MRISHRALHCCLSTRALVLWVDGSAQGLFSPQNKLPNVNCSRWHNCMAWFLPIYWKETKLRTSVKRAWLGHFSIWGRRGRRAACSPCSCSLSHWKALEEGRTPRACSTGLCRAKRVSNSAGIGEKALPVI